MNEPEEILDVVDEDNVVVGNTPKAEVYTKLLNHRIVHVLVFNTAGEMLLQLRSKNKSFMPGYWVTSAGGHVGSGETYEVAALRELQEELGVTGKLEFLYSDVYIYENKCCVA